MGKNSYMVQLNTKVLDNRSPKSRYSQSKLNVQIFKMQNQIKIIKLVKGAMKSKCFRKQGVQNFLKKYHDESHFHNVIVLGLYFVLEGLINVFSKHFSIYLLYKCQPIFFV